MSGEGLPYMGSKRKLASKILDVITARHPQARYFFDLFGGGAAVSLEALKRPQFERVTYNDLNTGVVELLRKIQVDGVTPDFYKRISREEFHALKTGDDWKAGLVKTCWSFGNDQRTYIFGPKVEPLKRVLHEIVVNRCERAQLEYVALTGEPIPTSALNAATVNERRLAVMAFVKSRRGRFELEHLERLKQLQQLQQLPQLERLELRNLPFDRVVIDAPPSETVVHLDPPYKNTKGYQEQACHAAITEFALVSPFPVYISGYETGGFSEVAQWAHRSTLNSNTSKPVVERLMGNRSALL